MPPERGGRELPRAKAPGCKVCRVGVRGDMPPPVCWHPSHRLCNAVGHVGVVASGGGIEPVERDGAVGPREDAVRRDVQGVCDSLQEVAEQESTAKFQPWGGAGWGEGGYSGLGQ